MPIAAMRYEAPVASCAPVNARVPPAVLNPVAVPTDGVIAVAACNSAFESARGQYRTRRRRPLSWASGPVLLPHRRFVDGGIVPAAPLLAPTPPFVQKLLALLPREIIDLYVAPCAITSWEGLKSETPPAINCAVE